MKPDEKKKEGKGTKGKVYEEPPFKVKENKPEIAESLVCLDWHNSDLNLRITDDLLSGIPFSRMDGVTATPELGPPMHLKTGKTWLEVKYLDNMDVKIERDMTTFNLRMGWSRNTANMLLGEDQESWCHSLAKGKMAHMRVFQEYGEKFTKGDVIGACIDFEGNKVSLTLTKNGEDQGDAFQIIKTELGDAALFPHIMARNVKFEVNFGLNKEAKAVKNLKEKLEGAYIKAGVAGDDARVRGSGRIEKREVYEMMMMIGHPASGKTT